MAKKEKKEPEKPSTAWQGTYGDMITLMLCFFVMLYNPEEVDAVQMAALTASINGDPTKGGGSLSSTGRLADLGNTISSMPSMEQGRYLGLDAKRAVSAFAPEIHTNKITISSDERGVVITLASDFQFRQGSAELDIEETRDALQELSTFLSQDDLSDRKFRIEGHAETADEYKYGPDGERGKYQSSWELSTARACNILHYLTDFGVDETRFSVAGYAEMQPKYDEISDNTSHNRRVDIIILDEAHF